MVVLLLYLENFTRYGLDRGLQFDNLLLPLVQGLLLILPVFIGGFKEFTGATYDLEKPCSWNQITGPTNPEYDALSQEKGKQQMDSGLPIGSDCLQQHSCHAGVRDAYTALKWTRHLRTKIRKWVPTKRNREKNAAFQKHLYH